MNFKLILCGLGFHENLTLACASGDGTEEHRCDYCDTWIKFEYKKNKLVKKTSSKKS
jgi:hypothetical protein